MKNKKAPKICIYVDFWGFFTCSIYAIKPYDTSSSAIKPYDTSSSAIKRLMILRQAPSSAL